MTNNFLLVNTTNGRSTKTDENTAWNKTLGIKEKPLLAFPQTHIQTNTKGTFLQGFISMTEEVSW